MNREEKAKEWWNHQSKLKCYDGRWETLDGVCHDDHDRVPNIILGLSKLKWNELPDCVKKVIRISCAAFYDSREEDMVEDEKEEE